MKTARTKLLTYALALVIVFAAAWAIGAAVGPDNPSPAPTGNPHGH